MADGKIIIETDIDTSGAEQGTKSLRSQAASLAVEYRKAGMDQSDAMSKAWAVVKGESSTGSKKLKDDLDDVGKSTKDTGNKLSELGQTAKNGLKVVGGAIAAAFAVDKIIEFGKAAIEAAGSAKAIESQFTQVFGDLEPAAQTAIDKMADKFGMVPNRLKPSMSQMTSMFKGLGLDTETAMAKATDAVTASADAAAFYDVSYSDANSALTSFIKGNYEGGEAIGLFANDTQMAQYAIQKGLVGTTAEWSSLDEATKQATRLEYAQNMQNLAGATGQAARESDGLENQLGNINQAWTDFLAIIGGPVLGLAVDALKGLTTGLQLAGEGFKTLIENAQNMDFSGVAAEFEPFLIQFEYVKMALVGAFEQAKTKVMEVMPQIIEAVQPILGAFQSLWDNLKPVFLYLVQTLYESVIPALSALFNAFMDSLPAIISFVTPIYEVLTNVIGFVGNVIGLVVALLRGDWDSAWQFAGSAVQNIVDTIGSILNFLWGVITGIFSGIGTSIATAWQGIYDNTIGKVTETATAISTKWQETQTDTQVKWDSIKGDLATKWEEIKTNIGQKAQEIFQNVSEKWSAVQSDSQTKWSAVRDDISGKAKEIFDNVTTKVKEIVDDLPGKWESIKTVASTAWDGIVTTITTIAQNLPGEIYKIAGDMITKIGDGINDNIEKVKTAVGGLVTTIKDKFTEALGIHSPSTVFADYGYNIIQGLIEGLQGTDLTTFVNNMVEQIKGAFGEGKFSFKTFIDFIGTGAKDFLKSIGIGGADLADLIWPTITQYLTDFFGWRTHPITGEQQYHAGVDIGAGYGEAVMAAGSGTIVQAGWNGGYGNSITIDHGDGLTTLYGHLSEIAVAVGDLVSVGQKIGEVGSTGNSTGPHLHFEVTKDGQLIDPSEILNGSSVSTASEDLTKSTEALTTSMAEITDLSDSIKTAMGSVSDQAPQDLSNSLDSILGFSIEDITGLSESLNQAVADSIAGINEQFTQFRESGVIALDEIKTNLTLWFDEMATLGLNGAEVFRYNITAALAPMPNMAILIGKQIVQGIWGGISGDAGWLYSKVAEFALGILQAMKNALGIASPSKEAEDQIGIQIPAGIDKGITKAMPALETSMLSNISGLMEKMQTAVILESAKLSASISSTSTLNASGNTPSVVNNTPTTNNHEVININQPITTLSEAYREAKIRRKEAAFGY